MASWLLEALYDGLPLDILNTNILDNSRFRPPESNLNSQICAQLYAITRTIPPDQVLTLQPPDDLSPKCTGTDIAVKSSTVNTAEADPKLFRPPVVGMDQYLTNGDDTVVRPLLPRSHCDQNAQKNPEFIHSLLFKQTKSSKAARRATTRVHGSMS